MEAIIHSVKKTGRVLIVHEAPAAFGMSAEIVRRIVAEAFDFLDAEPLVYGGVRTVTPFSGVLEDLSLLKSDEIVQMIDKLTYGVNSGLKMSFFSG